MKLFIRSLLVFAMGSVLHVSGQAATEAEIENSFRPYKDGFPSFPGLTAGTVINKQNADQFKDALIPEVYQRVKSGDVEITVGKQISAPYPKAYIAATAKYSSKVTLKAGSGAIGGYVAGRPFPGEPSASDPNMGEKMAWNHRYNLEIPDDAAVLPFVWKYKDATSGKVNRTVLIDTYLKNLNGRTLIEPQDVKPNVGDNFQYLLMRVTAPQDLKDTALLFKRFNDNAKYDDGQLYLGFQRRARRLSTGAATDPFLGSNLMIEEFHGYNARITDMKWKYLGTKNVLMPFYNHNDAKLTEAEKQPDWKFTAHHGKGECYVNAPWSLRKVHMVEMTPAKGDHPISKRIMYLDAESYFASVNVTFDRKGELWKLYMQGVGHPDGQVAQNKKYGVWVWDAAGAIDVQSNQCTTLGQRTVVGETPLNVYSLDAIRN